MLLNVEKNAPDSAQASISPPYRWPRTHRLALTKLNYNACKLGNAQPVTVAFSDAVGEILLSNPGVTDRRAQFRYYV